MDLNQLTPLDLTIVYWKFGWAEGTNVINNPKGM